MLNIKSLLQGSKRLRPNWKPDITAIKTASLRMTPMAGVSTLIVVAIIKGNTDKYRTSLMFTDLKITEKIKKVDCKQGFVAIKDKKKVNYCVKRANKDTELQVRCTCPDFYFTWAKWDKDQQSLYGGGLKPYKRKTTTYPERNPIKTPGICKHIIYLIKQLNDTGIIKT